MDTMRELILAAPLRERTRHMLLAESVIRRIHWQKDYPIEHISSSACEALHSAVPRRRSEREDEVASGLIRLLEAYLAVTKQKIGFDGECFSSIDALVGFAGALYSGKFLHASPLFCYKWVARWRGTLENVCVEAYRQIPPPSSVRATMWFETARDKFEKIELDPMQRDLWRGWACPKSNGAIAWLDLRKIYLRFGKALASAYAHAVAGYLSGRNEHGITMAQPFADFLANLPSSWRIESFRSRAELASLFASFLLAQCKVSEENKIQYSTLLASWGKFVVFAKSYLCTGRYFAKMESDEFVKLPHKEGKSTATNRRRNEKGEVFIAKLLTDVPLYLNDEEATELIYVKIQRHLGAIKAWADYEVNDLWVRLKRRKELASKGTIKQVLSPNFRDGRRNLVDRANHGWMANACATFEHVGFRARKNGKVEAIYPGRLENLASEILALPTAGALLPHMTLLVIEHPKLTASFFRELRLYDKDGQLSGVVETDVGWLLDGDKLRRGSADAEQQIHLSDRGAEIIAQVVEITRPLRKYLKEQNDPAWHYLFLSCGKGFAYPNRPSIANETVHLRTSCALERRFLASNQMTEHEASTLAARFSLSTVRASAAIVGYINEPDIQKFSEILGHKTLDMRLLERYLPAPLLRYFEQRWVRLFQCGILVEALKDSRYLLPAVGFTTLHELNQFISNHALKWNSRPGTANTKARHLFDSVVFSISEEILTLLVSIQVAVRCAARPVTKLAEMWANYAEKLFAYIESSEPPKNDFKAMLSAAKQRMSADLVPPEVIYA